MFIHYANQSVHSDLIYDHPILPTHVHGLIS